MTKLVRLARPDGKRVKGAAYERPRLRQILAEHDPVLLAAQGLIVELVLTGGAGSGKTTVLPLIAAALREQGWRVLVRPEVASMILSGVPDIATIIEAEPVRYQVIETAMIGMRLDLRRRYLVIAQALAERGERVAVVYERAEPDAEAYLGTARYEQVLAGLGTAKAAVRDSYQAVIHMVSAAVGAEDAYTRTNNAARFESVEAAARSEVRTRQAWSGHRRLVIIDSDSDLDRKLSRTVSTALALVNASVREIRRADP
jgi:thymidylate kinase